MIRNLSLVLLHCTFINETIKRQFRDKWALTGRLEKRQLNFALVLDNGSPVALTLLTHYLVQLLRHRDLLWFRVRLYLVKERDEVNDKGLFTRTANVNVNCR